MALGRQGSLEFGFGCTLPARDGPDIIFDRLIALLADIDRAEADLPVDDLLLGGPMFDR